jgi:transposase-like protein
MCPQRGIVDILTQGSQVGTDIVEETLVPGASVARVARKRDVNANQVFYWRKLFREGRLGIAGWNSDASRKSRRCELLGTEFERGSENLAVLDQGNCVRSRFSYTSKSKTK